MSVRQRGKGWLIDIRQGRGKRTYYTYHGTKDEAYEMEHDGWDIDIYVRSHTHSFDYSGNSQNLTINTPCWKGRDAYIEQKKVERADNGYVLINVDGSNYSWEHMVFNVPEKIYTS